MKTVLMEKREIRIIDAVNTPSIEQTPDALLAHIDKMMVELIALRQAVQEMVTVHRPITQQADQMLAAQIADDYLARQSSPNPEMHQRIEEIVLETIYEARINLTAIKTNPSTVITGNEMRSRLGLPQG